MPQLPTDYTGKYPARRRRVAYFKSAVPYLAAFLLFSIGLVSYSLLSRVYSPASVQQLGWQAWETINFELHQQEAVSSTNGTLADIGMPLNEFVSCICP